MRVEIRLLGEVEVNFDDRLIDIGHARQWCVLAVLLIDANHPVSVDQLIERAWGSQRPQRVRNALYTYLSRLRQALASASVEIVRRPTGYVLTVDPLAVDLHRFRHLITQARASDNDTDALALFEQALKLWRGQAFATLDTPWLDTVRIDLEGQRLDAQLDRADLALRHGDHGLVLADLSAAAVRYPLDERLAGQLMLAHYRCGRQALALNLYEQIRIHLADELGADPSPPLQQLYQQILKADAALATPTPVVTIANPGLAGRSVPRQLPAPPRSFTGRARELAYLNALLAQGDGLPPATVAISAVAGTAGVGKTALAVHWAHQVRHRFPDGQLYVNLRGFDPAGAVMAPAEAVRGFLDALNVPPQRIPAGLDAQAGLYRSLLADKRVLVVLDNARDAGQVRPLLPGTPSAAVIVTSRNRLAGLIAADGAHPLALDLLSTTEARDLLTHRLGPGRVTAEPDAVNEIIVSCAWLPLALTIVAGRAATNPRFRLQSLAIELRHARDRLNVLADTDPAIDVRAVFSWSYHTLSEGAARLFRLLGMHPGPDISAAAAASLTGLPPPQIQPLLAELTHAHLVNEHQPGRYNFHDLLRAYAAEQIHSCAPVNERQAAIHRVLDHYLRTAYIAARLLHPTRDPISLCSPQPSVTPEDLRDYGQALAWFTAEHAVLLAVIDCAVTIGSYTHAWQLAWTLPTYFERLGHWHDWAATGHAGLEAARRLADPSAQARTHLDLARAYTRLGRHEDAERQLRRALDLYGQTGEQTGQGHAHLHLAWVYERRDGYADALHHCQRALALFLAVGNRAGQASALNNVGWFHARLGDYQQALIHCQQALTLLRELGNRGGQAATWDSLGYAHHHLGHHQQAITCYQHALDLFRSVGDRYEEATTLAHLGDTHYTTSDPEAARDAWQRALAVLDELDHPDADQVRAKLHGSDSATRT
ncbi:AfsR/SARP family transcriptional regulator [Virgisporangium aurantiacum]|uniref:SARP family transcriptional regulator n=1 Tax=Virgisporangium aurantiacum TaxID=175570 RepID=A0A8J3ZFU1_9ACTN|nr:BTAD domain-containing putative transcriptional regulator [Virgisporangium aurantiacum]GIJ62013.1 SARP family transcriptional regulator [Virgisporangium aurantiacum]